MAIDTRRKRASVAGLALAFLGPAVVPDGTIAQADRQTIAHSYFGILAGAGAVELGGTSQLEAFSSTGGITLERTIGGTNQLGAFSSTGGITLERTIGGTSQLEAFSSTGTIQVGDVVETEETATGGFWVDIDAYQLKHRALRKKLKKKKEKSQQIKDDLIRQIAIEERKREEDELKIAELERLTKLVESYQKDLNVIIGDNMAKIANRAIETKKFSAMEQMQRELNLMREEEMFILEAAKLLLH